MLIVDGTGVPLGMVLAPASTAEITLAPETLANVRVAQPRGRPRVRPRTLVCDRGYDSRAFRAALRRRGIRPCIPPRRKPSHTKRKRRGRPVSYDRQAYGRRYVVERTFAWLLSRKRLVVRWEREIGLYRGFMLLAMAMICLNRLLQ